MRTWWIHLVVAGLFALYAIITGAVIVYSDLEGMNERFAWVSMNLAIWLSIMGWIAVQKPPKGH